MNLRKYAHGKPCQIRLPGCAGIHEGNCLCHWRDGTTGMSKKEHDIIGAHGCWKCHAIVDGHAQLPEGYTREEVRYNFVMAIIRTQKVLAAEGVI